MANTVSVLKQVEGVTLKLREESSRGFVTGANYVAVKFYTADATTIHVEVRAFANKPILHPTGEISASTGDAEYAGMSLPLPAFVYDNKLSFQVNMEKAGLKAVSDHLLVVNPGSSFAVEVLTEEAQG